MCKSLEKPKETRKLRTAYGCFPTGVAIVTARTSEGLPVGMTINSFTSISLVPALIAWSIDRSAASYRHFATASSFSITVLNDAQSEIARRFATRGEDKFRDIYSKDISKPITIPNGSAVFECVTHRAVALGDHLMLVGEVKHYEKTDHQPLLFVQGKFRQLEEASTQAA